MPRPCCRPQSQQLHTWLESVELGELFEKMFTSQADAPQKQRKVIQMAIRYIPCANESWKVARKRGRTAQGSPLRSLERPWIRLRAGFPFGGIVGICSLLQSCDSPSHIVAGWSVCCGFLCWSSCLWVFHSPVLMKLSWFAIALSGKIDRSPYTSSSYDRYRLISDRGWYSHWEKKWKTRKLRLSKF